jgi:hypothetical protein
LPFFSHKKSAPRWTAGRGTGGTSALQNLSVVCT